MWNQRFVWVPTVQGAAAQAQQPTVPPQVLLQPQQQLAGPVTPLFQQPVVYMPPRQQQLLMPTVQPAVQPIQQPLQPVVQPNPALSLFQPKLLVPQVNQILPVSQPMIPIPEANAQLASTVHLSEAGSAGTSSSTSSSQTLQAVSLHCSPDNFKIANGSKLINDVDEQQIDNSRKRPHSPRKTECISPKQSREDCNRRQGASLPKRQWQLSTFGQWYVQQQGARDYSSQPLDFTVLSYNILAQNLVLENISQYMGCDEDILLWPNRREHLKRKLTSHKPTIMCLQEVQSSQFEDFFYPTMTEMGYEGIFKARTGNKQDGCALFWLVSEFSPVDGLDGVEALEFNIPGTISDRDNVGLVVRLRATREPHARLVVATSHLLFNPRRGDVKLVQLAMLLAAIDDAASRSTTNGQRDPVIFCGDFNAEPFTPLYDLIAYGSLRYTGLKGKDVCNKGFPGSVGPVLTNSLLTQDLGVTDYCRRWSIVQKEIQEAKRKAQDKSLDPDKRNDLQKIPRKHFGSGTLRHELKLASAYTHFVPGRGQEVTAKTFPHGSKTTKTNDYLFYSVRERRSTRHGQPVEQQLRLVSTLSLFTASELQKLGAFPCKTHPSDHIELLARFLLLPVDHELAKDKSQRSSRR